MKNKKTELVYKIRTKDGKIGFIADSHIKTTMEIMGISRKSYFMEKYCGTILEKIKIILDFPTECDII